ncbi:Uncharacterised protein [Mycobacteroides abscessus subsp. abscessus]|nr:Uncharacterised protein [Mycobacteroides abscessus subsp. abscessus]
MLSIPIMLNDRVIGSVTIRRLESFSQSHWNHQYEWHATQNEGKLLDGTKIPYGVATGKIFHTYRDGSWALTARVLEAAGKALGR